MFCVFFVRFTSGAQQKKLMAVFKEDDESDLKVLTDVKTLPAAHSNPSVATDALERIVSAISQGSPVYHHSVRWSLPSGSSKADCTGKYRELFTGWLGTVADHYLFQLEDSKGDGVNVHFQGYLHTKDKIRSPQLMFSLMNTCKQDGQTLFQFNVSPASKTGQEALRLYCMKPDTRIGGPWSDRLIYTGADVKENYQPHVWQESMEERLLTRPNDRDVMHLYDQRGKSGKSFFAKRMCMVHKACVMSFASYRDMMDIVSNNKYKSIYIFDLSRTKPGDFKMDDLWSVVEQIKNGQLTSTKFKTNTWCQDTAHVLVMSNYPADKLKLSDDRWINLRITDGKLENY